MGLGPGLHIRQAQSLVMSQQLQQAIKLLALSNMELEAVIAEEMAKNPLLEARPGEAGQGEGVVIREDGRPMYDGALIAVFGIATSARENRGRAKAGLCSLIFWRRLEVLQDLAEGIEDEDTQQFLRNIGCTLAQGYLFARPLTAEAAERVVCAAPGEALAAVAMDAA